MGKSTSKRSGARRLVPKQATSYRFEPPVAERLEWLAAKLKVNKTEVLERAVLELAERQGFTESRIRIFYSWCHGDSKFAEEARQMLIHAVAFKGDPPGQVQSPDLRPGDPGAKNEA